VRLKTSKPVLDALKGKDERKYNALIDKRNTANQRLINAFESNWTVCPVYYFYSDNSNLVKDKKFDGILLDKNLNPLSKNPQLDNNYLIADLSFTQGDTVQIYRGNYLSTDGDNLKRQPVYGLEDSNTLEGLVLLTPELYLLQYPYPYFSKKYILFITRSEAKMVMGLQNKILEYLRLQELQSKN